MDSAVKSAKLEDLAGLAEFAAEKWMGMTIEGVADRMGQSEDMKHVEGLHKMVVVWAELLHNSVNHQ